MASVQELLLAAQAKREANRSPLISLIENAISGYGEGKQMAANRIAMEDKRLESQARRLKFQQEQADAERAAEEDRISRNILAGQEEAAINTGFKAVGGGIRPVAPAKKLEMTISPDDKGRYRRSVKVIDTEEKGEKSLDAILASRVNSGELSLEEAYSLKAKGSPASVQFVGMQDGKPVFLNPKTSELSTGNLPGEGPLISTTQSEGQANAKLYSDRAEEASIKINEIASKIDLTSLGSAAQAKSPNVFKSGKIQGFEQAKRNFVNAVLRRESGAVISPSEFENADKQYFPQFGDTEEVLKQKAQNRETAIQGLKNAAGINYKSHAKSPEKRFDELVSSGKSEEEAYQTLKQEGY